MTHALDSSHSRLTLFISLAILDTTTVGVALGHLCDLFVAFV